MRTAARRTSKADETPEFIAFWDTWRPVMNKNDGRGAARDEFFRHVEVYRADPLDIVDGARWYVRQGGNGEFKLHAQTWLNRRAYEDGCEQERAYQARLAEAKDRRAAPAPQPISRPVQPPQSAEERAAMVKRVYERQGLQPPENLH